MAQASHSLRFWAPKLTNSGPRKARTGAPSNERAHELAVAGMEEAAFNSPESRAGSSFTWNSDYLQAHLQPRLHP